MRYYAFYALLYLSIADHADHPLPCLFIRYYVYYALPCPSIADHADHRLVSMIMSTMAIKACYVTMPAKPVGQGAKPSTHLGRVVNKNTSEEKVKKKEKKMYIGVDIFFLLLYLICVP